MKKEKKTRINTTSFLDSGVHGECVYNEESKEILFATKTDSQINYKTIHSKGSYEYVPAPQVQKLIHSGTLKLAESAQPHDSTKALIDHIREFIHRNVDLSDTFEIICTYYVLLTWLYDKYNELPYLRVRGDYGSGKTRFLNVIGSLCYKPIFASGASTTAPLFHLLNDIKGTLVLDESDFRYSDATAELTKILNNGNTKGFSVLRCEQSNNGKFNAIAYSIYGPKIIATRGSFTDDALESRFISEDLGGEKLREDVPISLPDSFEAEAKALRNMLLHYRFTYRTTSTSNHALDMSQITGRTQQIYLPLLSLIQDEDELSKVYNQITEYEEQIRSDRGLQTEAELLQIIKSLMRDSTPLSITKITKSFMIKYGQRYSRRITPKWIGHLLRSKLHLSTRKSNGVYIIAESQSEKLNSLFIKYDVE